MITFHSCCCCFIATAALTSYLKHFMYMKMTDEEMLFDEVKKSLVDYFRLDRDEEIRIISNVRNNQREPLTIGPETYNAVIPSQENIMRYQLER